MVQLKEDERLDYLLAENLRIIQSPSVFAFSLDAVLLAKFTYVPIQKGKIIDLCTGNAIVPLLLSTRSKAKIFGVEIQERLYDMGKRSIEYNELQEQIELVHGDVKEMPKFMGYQKFDVVTCNPPYFPVTDRGIINEKQPFAIARHELYLTLEEAIQVSGQLVKPGGKVTFVHRPGRLLDIITSMRLNNIEPKRLRFVYPKKDKDANTILVEGMKDGKKDLKIEPPLFVYDENNQYTTEVKEILYGGK
ncbi:tRNA1(Val) (adenine(37)-N6)-methyltransferase [Bacillus kwashiorkori]|uniref:tRNA1(Val) (adenine(37)-N6)-methyltransferase n=1 Tax=Bacillus kwashiorkori TaxID=1522318 RepID=UPI000780DE04|nr:tRNA1(Val) (adenine(37)-N6)-methyltransferase [Bacillus kwashiorkori]